MKRSELFFAAARVPVDLLMVFLAFLAAYQLRLSLGEVEFYWKFDQYLAFVASLAPFWIPIFALTGLYSLKRNQRAWEEFGSIFVGISGGTFLVIAWPFLTRQEFFSRLVVLYLFLFALLFVTLGRVLVRLIKEYLYRYGVGVQRVLVIGSNSVAARFTEEISDHPNLGMRIIGIVKPKIDSPVDETLRKYPILGYADNIRTFVKRSEIDEILIADPSLRRAETLDLLEFAEDAGISFKVSPSLLDVHATRIGIYELAGVPLLEYRRTPLEGWGMIWKRFFDIVISVIVLIITSPIMLLTALAVKLDSKGPVFFSRLDDGGLLKRVGQHGKPFHYFKFRSMQPGTDSMRYHELKHLNVREGGPLVKIKDDPRITRVGKFIRKFSLDELTEFYLVFIGRMSLVGPRPHLPEEVAKYQPHQRRVLMLKPGITGMGQISGRSDLSFDDEVRLDTYYIENWSPWLDLQILLKTPFAVLGRRQKAGD